MTNCRTAPSERGDESAGPFFLHRLRRQRRRYRQADRLPPGAAREARRIRPVRADDFWLTRIRDNRVRGLLAELAEAISACDDADLLHLIKGSLRLGLVNQAAAREQELRDAARKRTLSTMPRRARRLGR